MEHLWKHMAVRLWATLIMGGLTSLLVLLPFAGIMGPAWMIIPGIGFLAGSYWLVGVGFSAIGRRRMNRLMDEATLWERAGMAREVRQALARALNTVNSFYFSPRTRKNPARRLLAQTARFQMAMTVTELPSDDVVEAYLISFPQDRDIARKWLDGVLAGDVVTHKSHDIAARIIEAHQDDREVLQLVARFYVNERCCDLTALQTYRHVMDTGGSLPDDLIYGMADLFLSQSRVDTLALTVYLACCKLGRRQTRLLQGIAACSRSIRSGPMTSELLNRADTLLSKVDASLKKEMAEAFLPVSEGPDPVRTRERKRITLPPIGVSIRRSWIVSKTNARRMAAGFSHKWQQINQGMQSSQVKRVLKWVALGTSIVGVVWLVINTISHLSTPPKTVETSPPPVVASVTDPFTIQVAAYLKEADARHYVGQLKEIGMDAYWIRATGGGKNWYQVRISHFESKAAAKAFGESLKARGVVGDYYVANYDRPDR